MNTIDRSADIARTLTQSPPDPAAMAPRPVISPFKPFPVDSLPERVANFVMAVAGATGTDPSWAALAALVVMAGCLGNRVAIVLKKGWIEPAILWAALVGKSGSTKSVVLRLVSRPLVELLKKKRDEFSEKLNAYHADMERHQAALKEWKSQHKSDPSIGPPQEPEKPREQRILVSDITVEKLAALLGENPLGLLVVRDELAGLVNSFNRYAGGKGSDLQSWLSMNDAGPLLVDRKIDGSTFVERATVSLLGTIQPFTLQSVFGALEREAGLLARVLLAYPPDRPAYWTDQELPEEVAGDWQELLASFTEIEPSHDETGRPCPHYLGMEREAKALFKAWHDRHAHEVADLDDEHLRSHWSKLKGMCARIALIFACTRTVPCGKLKTVSADDVDRAIRITEWLKQESARIYHNLTETDDDRDRRKLVDWIERHGGSTTVRDLTHGVWSLRNNPEAARKALDELVGCGVGHWEPVPNRGGGRSTERFVLGSLTDLTITETPIPGSAMGGFGDGDEIENAKRDSGEG